MKKLLLIIILTQLAVSCSDDKGMKFNPQGFDGFIAYIKSIARQQGIKEATLDSAFQGAAFDEKIVELDAKQPERKPGPGWDVYRNKVVSEARITKAREMLFENYNLLNDIESRFGVQKEILVSLWAVESSFGQIMGKNDIVNSLASLAYEGRRREFFQKELINSLVILDQGHVTKENFKGSWAGAFGQVQFMPSTFLTYAYDYDGDGRKDLWYNNGDALASAANYLKSLGWEPGTPWGTKVVLPNGFKDQYLGLETKLPVWKWRAMGVKLENERTLPSSDAVASIVSIDHQYGENRSTYLVYSNYERIMKWNKSVYFATSIGLIADSLKQGY